MLRKPVKQKTFSTNINYFTGVDEETDSSQLPVERATEMLNFKVGDDAKLKQRNGYKRIFDVSLGGTPVRGMWNGFINGTEYFIFTHGGNLYKHMFATSTNVLLDSSFADAPTFFIRFNDLLYMFDGTYYHSFDGTTIEDVNGIDAYHPTTVLGMNPDGTGGAANEDLNLISPGYVNQFNGDGDSTIYYVTEPVLDAVAVRVDVITSSGSERLYENTDFKVTRTTGTDTWEKAVTIPRNVVRLTVYNDKLYGVNSLGRLYEWDGVDAWIQKAPSSCSLYDLVVFNNKLYSAGSDGILYEWNDVDAWVQKAPQSGAEGIASLVVFNNKLYGGTYSLGNLYEWDGAAAWVQKATQMGAETVINSLAVYNNKLYGSTSPNGNLCEWDGAAAWVQKAPQLGAETTVRALVVYKDKLYGAGYMTGSLLEWNDVNAWAEKAPGIILHMISPARAETLVVYNNKLYVGLTPGIPALARMFVWDDISSWESADDPTAGGEQIADFAVFNNKVYAACCLGLAKLSEWQHLDFIDFSLGTSPYYAPQNGVNNVIITAYKTHPDFAERITKCRTAVAFSGTNDTRLIVAGNPNYPNKDWKSGLNDPTYFPINRDDIVGNDEAITGYVVQHESLDIIKESSIILREYEQYDAMTSEAGFPTKPLNDKVGSSCLNSVQLIENNPFLVQEHTGVWVLAPHTAGRTEMNVTPMSRNINPTLLEEDLTDIVTFDNEKEGEYWVVSGDKAWVYNYKTVKRVQDAVWYKYDNIPASSFILRHGNVYFGDNANGLIYHFSTAYRNDDEGGANEQAVNALWYGCLFDCGSDAHYKHIVKVILTIKPSSNFHVKAGYATEEGVETDITAEYEINTGLFTFANVNFANFSFNTSENAKPYVVPIFRNGVVFFQVRLENNELNSTCQILRIRVEIVPQSEVK